MFGAIPLAHQPGADHRVARIADHGFPDLLALDFVGERIEQLPRRLRQTAEGQLLDPVGQALFQERPAVVGRFGPEQLFPFDLQLFDRHGLQRRQLGQHLRIAFILHHRPPFRAFARGRLTLLAPGEPSELSPPWADIELDCSRSRSTPAATMRPNSAIRASGVICSGARALGWLWACIYHSCACGSR